MGAESLNLAAKQLHCWSSARSFKNVKIAVNILVYYSHILWFMYNGRRYIVYIQKCKSTFLHYNLCLVFCMYGSTL